ncbi:MAG: enoyl-CoA hydratase/isomerase family protein [Aliidongia sp.]
MAAPLLLSDLADLAAVPSALPPHSPLTAQPYLVIDPNGAMPTPDRERIAAWLARQPCPVLGIGAAAGDPVRDACDVVVAKPADLAPLIGTIEAAPIAAMVLVQLLRATVSLPIAEGLVAESLAYATLQAGPEFARWLAARKRTELDEPGDPGPPVLLDRIGADLSIRLNRPARRNAISVEMRDALVEAFQLVAADASIERVLVTGAGRCFSIGGDLDEFGTVPDAATGHVVRSLRLPAAALLPCAERVAFQLHGACIGAGIELPAFGHRVTAAADSFFQLPELRFGLIPGAGGCISLPRRIGRQRTGWLALSGRRIDAARALDWGLIDEIVG